MSQLDNNYRQNRYKSQKRDKRPLTLQDFQEAYSNGSIDILLDQLLEQTINDIEKQWHEWLNKSFKDPSYVVHLVGLALVRQMNGVGSSVGNWAGDISFSLKVNKKGHLYYDLKGRVYYNSNEYTATKWHYLFWPFVHTVLRKEYRPVRGFITQGLQNVPRSYQMLWQRKQAVLEDLKKHTDLKMQVAERGTEQQSYQVTFQSDGPIRVEHGVVIWNLFQFKNDKGQDVMLHLENGYEDWHISVIGYDDFTSRDVSYKKWQKTEKESDFLGYYIWCRYKTLDLPRIY